jgi:hypothetical protein
VDERWPLIGRDAEREFCLAGSAVVIGGSAGVGKTRLLREVVLWARSQGWSVEEVCATAAGRDVPLGACAGLRGAGAPGGDPIGMVVAAARERLQGPALLAVDDAHLLDAPSAHVVAMLAREAQIACVVSARTGELLHDAISGLWKDRGGERLELQMLSEAETARLAADRVEPAERAGRRRPEVVDRAAPVAPAGRVRRVASRATAVTAAAAAPVRVAVSSTPGRSTRRRPRSRTAKRSVARRDRAAMPASAAPAGRAVAAAAATRVTRPVRPARPEGPVARPVPRETAVTAGPAAASGPPAAAARVREAACTPREPRRSRAEARSVTLPTGVTVGAAETADRLAARPQGATVGSADKEVSVAAAVAAPSPVAAAVAAVPEGLGAAGARPGTTATAGTAEQRAEEATLKAARSTRLDCST